MSTKSKSKTIPVEIEYIKSIYDEVCDEWKYKLHTKFPQLGLKREVNIGDIITWEDGEIVILIIQLPTEGIVLRTNNPDAYPLFSVMSFDIQESIPYKGRKIDLNKVFKQIK